MKRLDLVGNRLRQIDDDPQVLPGLLIGHAANHFPTRRGLDSRPIGKAGKFDDDLLPVRRSLRLIRRQGGHLKDDAFPLDAASEANSGKLRR